MGFLTFECAVMVVIDRYIRVWGLKTDVGTKDKAVSELAATGMAMASFPCHPGLKYRMSLTTPLATVVAVAIAANQIQP